MKKVFMFFLVFIMLSACSNGKSGSPDQSVEPYAGMGESGLIGMDEVAVVETEDMDGSEQEVASSSANMDRKVMYSVDMMVETDDFENHFSFIKEETTRVGGYIVESAMYNSQSEVGRSGYVTVRIPQEDFHEFIEIVEGGSIRVLERSISGQDVTEEYVDLESRLKSKRQVEERLLVFMESAEETEDLLKISDDLARVQEEIETIVGRMKYIQEKTDYATVTITIIEKNIKYTSLHEDDLNTWDETKTQWTKSINFILSTFSGLFVFFIGNSPVILFILLFATIGYMIWRKFKRKRLGGNHHKDNRNESRID